MNERIWGFDFGFQGFDSAWLRKLRSEFSGAMSPSMAASATVEHAFVRWTPGSPTLPGASPVQRHAGGSSGDKRFLDGSVFAAKSQERFVEMCDEAERMTWFTADQALCFSGEMTTVLVGGDATGMLLADLVESRLLIAARRRGWLHCHAAAWTTASGEAIACFGDSGYGKTTQLLQGVAAGGRFIGNDRILVREVGGELQVRGFPIAMNIGAGTIRELGLDLPHFGLPDRGKIRLTPEDVQHRFAPDYDGWFRLGSVRAESRDSLLRNVYLQGDPCHPPWNTAWASGPHPGFAAIAERLVQRTELTASIAA